MFLCIVWLFRIVPGGLVPNEDQGYLLGMAILDDGAAQPRTTAVNKVLNDFMLKNPAVLSVGTLSGLDITSMAAKSNYGTFFALLKPWDERKDPKDSADAIVNTVGAVTVMDAPAGKTE